MREIVPDSHCGYGMFRLAATDDDGVVEAAGACDELAGEALD